MSQITYQIHTPIMHHHARIMFHINTHLRDPVFGYKQVCGNKDFDFSIYQFFTLHVGREDRVTQSKIHRQNLNSLCFQKLPNKKNWI